jgi:hypothetical protein
MSCTCGRTRGSTPRAPPPTEIPCAPRVGCCDRASASPLKLPRRLSGFSSRLTTIHRGPPGGDVVDAQDHRLVADLPTSSGLGRTIARRSTRATTSANATSLAGARRTGMARCFRRTVGRWNSAPPDWVCSDRERVINAQKSSVFKVGFPRWQRSVAFELTLDPLHTDHSQPAEPFQRREAAAPSMATQISENAAGSRTPPGAGALELAAATDIRLK